MNISSLVLFQTESDGTLSPLSYSQRIGILPCKTAHPAILIAAWISTMVGCAAQNGGTVDSGDLTLSTDNPNGTDGDADMDSDADGDMDSDADTDTDADADGDTDADTDADNDGDTDTDGDGDTSTTGTCRYTCQDHCQSVGGSVMDGSCPNPHQKCCDMGPVGDTDGDTDMDGDADTDADGDTDTDNADSDETDQETEPIPLGEAVCGVDPGMATGTLHMENLCRGVVAVRAGNGNFISWRLLGYEPDDTGFNVYRDGTKINDSPVTDSTNFVDDGAPAGATYTVRAIVDNKELGDSSVSRTDTSATPTWGQNYLEIPLDTPRDYRAGDTSVGDLDGDGEYELVVKEENSPQDPSKAGVTGQPKFAAYDLDGTFLWRVDLGINIRESEHTTPFVVYDLDGDGKAELVVKTAPGTRDGTDAFLSLGPAANDNDNADYRDSEGRILSGPEYLTVFSGTDGRELATVEYHALVDSGDWGDNYGNRSDRYNASLAFLDGTGEPSVVMQRGYYARTTFGAYNYRSGKLTLLWKFDSAVDGRQYEDKGTHSMMVADVNGDNRQEIIPGSATIGPDGKGICVANPGAHGDALHVGDFDISRPGLEVFQPMEPSGIAAYTMRDAATCEILWQGPNSSGEGPGRGACDDISPGSPGAEAWVNNAGLFNGATGQNAGANPRSCNFLIWWDGDESRELLDGNSVSQYDGQGEGFSAAGCTSINGTKSVPNLSADIIGDWREEVIFSCGGSLRMYTTHQKTDRRIYTLMHDPQYRANVSAQNASYNQPPHTSFHIGEGMASPPHPDITVK